MDWRFIAFFTIQGWATVSIVALGNIFWDYGAYQSVAMMGCMFIASSAANLYLFFGPPPKRKKPRTDAKMRDLERLLNISR